MLKLKCIGKNNTLNTMNVNKMANKLQILFINNKS